MICVHDPVGITEIAERLRARPNTVSNWVKRFDDFPDPLFTLAAGRVWEWADITTWATAHHKITLAYGVQGERRR